MTWRVATAAWRVWPGSTFPGYGSIVIWCELTRNAYAGASLTP